MLTRPRHPRVALAAALCAGLVLTGCSGSEPSSSPSEPADDLTAPIGTAATGSIESTPALPTVSADLVGDLQDVLDARADAIVDGDRAAFLATLADKPDLRGPEGRYFDNVAQLPIGRLSYRVVPASLVRTVNSYWGVVEIDLELSPYDEVPARSIDRFRFVRGADGAFLVASTTDEEWEADNLTVRQPWDTETIRVRETEGVLGIFDTADIRERAGVTASVERGIADIAARVPYTEWGQHAVVYALSDPAFLDSFDHVPGDDPRALDGVAFTVPAGKNGASTASTRFALNPDQLPLVSARRVDPDVDRLVRHELVHVALGDHDDSAPVWLSEGVAEWVSVQALPPARRSVPAVAIAAARRGIDTMPSDESFNGDSAATNYALAWWVCEWLAKTYGADAPWTLLESFESRPDDDPDAIVSDLLDVSTDQLAVRGARLLAATYPPKPKPTDTPTDGPTDGPTGVPTDGPTSGTSPSSPPTPADDYTIID